MKKIILLLLVLTCMGYAQFPDWLKYKTYPTFEKDSVAVAVETDVTPPLPAGSFVIAYVDTTQVNVKASGFAEVDSFMINFATSAYPTTRTGGTLLIAGSDSASINDDDIAANLTHTTIYYFRLWIADTLDNWTTADSANSDTITTPDLTAPTAGTLIASGVNYDSLKLQMTLSGNSDASSMARYALDDYPADTSAGTLLFGWRAYKNIDTTMALGVLTQDSVVYARVFHRDSLINLSYASDTGLVQYDDVGPLAGGLVINGVNYDSARIVITREGAAESKAYYMVRYDPNTIPADTTAGTLALNWRAYVNVDTTIYINVPADSGNSLSYWFGVFTRDSLGNVDNSSDEGEIPNTPVPTIASYVADTLGTDSVEFDLSGYAATGSSILRTWLGMSYSSIDPDTSAYGDSTYALSDSISSKHWAHGLTNEDTLYFYAITQNADGRLSVDYIDTLVVPDQWSPVAGTFTQGIKPIGMDTLIITSFAGTADLAAVYLDLWSVDAWVNVYSGADSSVDSTIENLAVNSVSWDAENDSLFARLRLYDEAGNYSSAYDTLVAASDRDVKILSDTSVSVIQAIRLYISADSNSTITDSSYFVIADCDTAFVGDTLVCNPPAPADTQWYAARPRIAGAWGTMGAWYKYPEEPTGDVTPPVAAAVFTATASDSSGITIVATGFAEWDTCIIRYAAGDYPTAIDDGESVTATNDSATIDDDTFVLDLNENTTYYVRMFLGDSLNNWIAAGDANSDTLTTPMHELIPPLPAGAFAATASDSTGITIAASGFPEAPDSIRIQYATTAYPTTRTAGTNLYAGHDTSAINDDLIAADLVCNTTYYVNMWQMDDLFNWQIADSANEDTATTIACAVVDYCANVTDKLFADTSDFWIDFSHTDGDSVACTANTELGAWSGASVDAEPDSGVSPGSGGAAMLLDATGDDIIFDNEDASFASAQGQLSFLVCVTADNTAAHYLVKVNAVDLQDRLLVELTATGLISVSWEDNNTGNVTLAPIGPDLDSYYGDWVQIHLKWDVSAADTSTEIGIRTRIDDNRDGDFGDGGIEAWSAWTYKAADLAAFASEPGAGEISFGLASGTYNVNIYLDDIEISNSKPY